MALLEPFRGKRIGFLGLTFKSATDDLRESPTLDLMARLAADGWEISAYDPNVGDGAEARARVAAAATARPGMSSFLDGLPDILARDAISLVENVDVIVVTHATDAFRRAIAGRAGNVHVLDMVRLFADLPKDATYDGVGW